MTSRTSPWYRPLGRLFRWYRCAICGSNESERVSIDVGDGERVVCVHVEACEARRRHPNVRRYRKVQTPRDRRAAMRVVS